jgi:hypothetical protein
MPLRHYLRRIVSAQQEGIIIHYDSTFRDLRTWYW